jgi:hypothetical protein
VTSSRISTVWTTAVLLRPTIVKPIPNWKDVPKGKPRGDERSAENPKREAVASILRCGTK